MGEWWCHHKDNSGREMTVLHFGDQCTTASENHGCDLWKKTWEFMTCTSANLREVDELHVVVLLEKAELTRPEKPA